MGIYNIVCGSVTDSTWVGRVRWAIINAKFVNAKLNCGDFWKTVKPLISNRGINKDDDRSLYLCLMMGKLLTTPMIYAEYSIIILRILLIAVDDTIYQDDTCESCISDHDNHRSIGQIRNLMKLAHTGETQFSFKTVDVTVIKKAP